MIVKIKLNGSLQHEDAGQLTRGLLVSTEHFPHEPWARTGHMGRHLTTISSDPMFRDHWAHLVLPGDGVPGQHPRDNVPCAVHRVGDGRAQVTR